MTKLKKIKIYDLEKIKNKLYNNIEKCQLCPIMCKVNRNETLGFCGIGNHIKISEYVLYPGEEPPLTGNTGSGGVFFSNCNMKCLYCQNFRFSQLGNGKVISVEELSEIFLKIQNEKKAKNLNLVTATPYLPFIVDALIISLKKGFDLPIVWNTSSYENIDIIEILDNFIDIYLPDIRYTSNIIGKKLSSVNKYWDICQKAIKKMYDLNNNQYIFNDEDVLIKGLIIRILVLPGYSNMVKEAFKYIKYELDENVYISLMDQYVPVYKAKNHELLSKFLSKSEYDKVIDSFHDFGFKNGWIQKHDLK